MPDNARTAIPTHSCFSPANKGTGIQMQRTRAARFAMRTDCCALLTACCLLPAARSLLLVVHCELRAMSRAQNQLSYGTFLLRYATSVAGCSKHLMHVRLAAAIECWARENSVLSFLEWHLAQEIKLCFTLSNCISLQASTHVVHLL